MKTIIITISAVALLTLAPRPAHAIGDTEAAILGGVLGGAIIGLAIDSALDDDCSYVEVGYGRSRGHDYGRGHRHGPSCGCSSCRPSRDRHYDRGYDRPDRGYWTYRSVKYWVPQRVWYSYDDCGRRVRHYQRGHWSWRKEKVWVPHRGRW